MPACILCSTKAVISGQEGSGRKIYNCPLCGMFMVSDAVEDQVAANNAKIASYMMSRRIRGTNDVISISFERNSEEKGYVLLTIPQILEHFPAAFCKRLDAALMNLAELSDYPGSEIIIERAEMAPLFFVDRLGPEAMIYMINALREAGWISCSGASSTGFPQGVVITPEGWRQADRIRLGKSSDETALIIPPASDYAEEFMKAVRKACRTVGYQVLQYKPEDTKGTVSLPLIAQVKSASFVICDMSQDAPEAYYAAGLARALGKPGLLACHEKSRKKLSVDAEQMSVIFWDTQDNLSSRLVHAIRAMI